MEYFHEEDIEEIIRVIDVIIQEAVKKFSFIQSETENDGVQSHLYKGPSESAEREFFHVDSLFLWARPPGLSFGEDSLADDGRDIDGNDLMEEEAFWTPEGCTPPPEDEDESTDLLNSNQHQIDSKHFQPYSLPITQNCGKEARLNTGYTGYDNGEVYAGFHNPQTSKKEQDEVERCSAPFTIEWCFGISLRVPLIYLPQRETFFAASHMGVLYNCESGTMRFLPGLTEEVSCAASGGGYLAFADSGSGKCAVVLWDDKGLSPRRCWVEALPGGASLLHLSRCGTQLTAVSAAPRPVLFRWELTNRSSLITTPLPEGSPIHLTYNNNVPNQCVVTYPKQLVILKFENGKNSFRIFKAERPKTSLKTGIYRTSTFNMLDSQIVTATSLGQVIIWTHEGRYLKTLQLHRTGATCLQLVNETIVIAFEDGSVWSYDQDMRMLSWFSLGQSPITSLSFLENPNTEFAFSTRFGSVGVASSRSNPTYFLHNISACILSIDCHPSNDTIVTGDARGKVASYHLKTNSQELSKTILGCGISVLVFSPTGVVLAAGSEQGDLLLLDPTLLTLCSVLPSARAAITHIIFTNNGKRLVYAHKASGIGLLKFTVDWNSRGKYRPHCKSITGVQLVGDRLFTVGEDRMVAELNVKHMLRLIGRFRVEQKAIPTCCVWYKGQLIVASSEFRLRFVNVEKKQITRTIRSPGSAPIHIMKLVNDRLLVYAAGKEIGACDLSKEGWGPGVVAHPRQVTHLCPYARGVLTTGQSDTVIFKWSLNHPLPVSEQFTFPDFQDHAIDTIFQSGPITCTQLFDHLRFLGYFPSKFDASNILREVDSAQIDKTTFRRILWNHGPPPGISVEELRNALLSVSDIVRMSGPVVETERLLATLEEGYDGEGMSRAEARGCLRILSAPGLMPPNISLEKFMTNILGVEPSLVADE